MKEKIQSKMNYVHPFHRNFNLVLNIMLGIRKSVDAVYDNPMYKATDSEYKIRCKYEIAPYRTDADDKVHSCDFYDYAP
jgi:hypothetical protein